MDIPSRRRNVKLHAIRLQGRPHVRHEKRVKAENVWRLDVAQVDFGPQKRNFVMQ
jgi:hypothetical protein